MMSKLVSVIIPAFNAEDFIIAAIDSVLGQSYSNLELIVVNDGSTDKTEKIIREISDSRVRVITQLNAGHSNARNTGIKNSTGELITFLDADDIWVNSKLEKQVLFLENYPDIGMVYSKGFIANNNLKINGQLSFQGNAGFIFDRLILNAQLIHCDSIMIKKEILMMVNCFDESLKSYEDWDLWLKISLVTQIGFLNEFLFIYRMQSSSNSSVTSSDKFYLRDALNVFDRNLKNVPSLLKKRAKVKSYIYRMEAFRHLRFSKNALARKYFIKSLKIYSLRVDALIGLSYTFLNYRAVSFIQGKIYKTAKVYWYSFLNILWRH